MVNIMKRMRVLRTLLGIRLGPGAAILPPEITRIHMEFARSLDGHYGAKQIWRKILPRLKYHNPAVPMTINRSENGEDPALMTIHFTTPDLAASTKTEISSTTSKQTSTGPVPESKAGPTTVRTETIDMKHYTESEILEQLMKLTRAKAVLPTAEETRQLRELEEQAERSERDSSMMAAVNAKRKREEEILRQARGAGGLV